MAAAVPVVGAVVGTAATVSSVAQQNKQAAQQRDAIAQQQSQAALDTQMRLIEIERQKAYINQQLELNKLSASQDRYVQQAQVSLEEQAIEQSKKEALLNQQLQATLLNQGADADTMRLLQQFESEKMGRQLDVAATRMGSDLQYLSESAMNELNTNNALYGSTAQLRGQMANLSNQDIAQLSSTNAELQKIADEYKQASTETKAFMRQRAMNIVSLAQGGYLSDSDRALLGSMDKEQLDKAADRILRGNQAQGVLKATEDYVLKMNEIAKQSALTQHGAAQAGAIGEGTIRQTSMDVGKQLSDTQLKLRDALAGMTAEQSYALEKLGIDNNKLLALDLQNVETVQQLSQAGLDQGALEVLKLTQKNSFELQNQQDELNKQFSTLALQGQGLSIQQQGLAQQQALKAQKESIRSPGTLGLLTTAGMGAYNIYNTLKQRTTSSQPTNPFYSQPQAQPQTPVNMGYSQLPPVTKVYKAPVEYTPANVTGTDTSVKLNLFGN